MPKSSDFSREQLARLCPLQLTVEEVLTLRTSMEISMMVGDRVAEGGTPHKVQVQADGLMEKLGEAAVRAVGDKK